MISKEHYFDWAATSPMDEEITAQAVKEASEHWGNPSSIHEAGTDARKALEGFRKRAASALGVPEKERASLSEKPSPSICFTQTLMRSSISL